MAVLLDEAGTALLDEAPASLYDEAAELTGTLVPQFIYRGAPLTATFAPCSAIGDTFETWYTTYLEVANSGESSQTCTVATPGKLEGLDEGDYQFTVPPGAHVEVGPFPPHIFGHIAAITYSDTTGLSIAVKRLGD